MKRLLLILLSACLLLMCACSASKPADEKGSVTIWYINGEPLELALRERCAHIQRESGIDIELCPIMSTEELATRLQGSRPDLLLCSHELAFGLDEQGMLKRLDVPGLECRAELKAKYPVFGSGFFPVGAAVELLCCRQLPSGTALSSFEALCTQLESSGQCMTIDSLARFMSAAIEQRGGQLSLSRTDNAADEHYRYIHNFLAENALSGMLRVFDEGGAELLRDGEIDAAIVPSTALVSGVDDFYIMPVPVMQGGERVCVGDMKGFAYTGNTFDNSASTARVLKMLLAEGAGAELAVGGGLVSAQSWEPASKAQLESALFQIYTDWEMLLPSPVSPGVIMRRQIEEELSAALGYLQ